VAVDELKDEFEQVTSIYAPNDPGRTLLDWLRVDWSLLKNIDEAAAFGILQDILGLQDLTTRSYSPSDMCRTDSIERWRAFRLELLQKNRFFPKQVIDLSRLKQLLPFLRVEILADEEPWYRARLQSLEGPFTPLQMGAPPATRANHGRANPIGIPYLYLSSSVETAITEVRPHTGEKVSVAQFRLNETLEVIDLRNPRDTVSPFGLEDATEVAQLRGDVEFLELLGDELTRPVLPHAAAIDYLPSQYLCEFIKACGYVGVLYRSAVGDGVNLALFNNSLATAELVLEYQIARVKVQYAEIQHPIAPV